MARGISAPAISYEKRWSFTPKVTQGNKVNVGDVLGVVPESSAVEHRIMLPAHVGNGATVEMVQVAGEYLVDEVIFKVKSAQGKEYELTMVQRWSIRTPRPVKERLPLDIPLITGQRVIDTLFPLAKGGAVALPGPFGAGKTMTQHAVAKWCDADIIVYIGCGERGNEMTDVLNEFPHLIDPRTGKSLMERTILIANTSNMPVSAREASVYTGLPSPSIIGIWAITWRLWQILRVVGQRRCVSSQVVWKRCLLKRAFLPIFPQESQLL